MAYVHAGAGIVADSIPERESAEVAAKAGAVLAALAEAEAGDAMRRHGRACCRQLRLVHLQPRTSCSADLGADVSVVRNDEVTVDEVARAAT